MALSSSVTESKATPPAPIIPGKLISIAGFGWDKTLLPFYSGGFLFLFGDDNKEEHEALKPVLLELLGSCDNKRKCFAELAKIVNQIFIYTQATEVVLVDEQGEPYTQLFYSGKSAIEKYLEALFGKDWQNIISAIHSINAKQSNPGRKSTVCLTNAQYEKLRHEVLRFRASQVVRNGNENFRLRPELYEANSYPGYQFEKNAFHLLSLVEGKAYEVSNNGMIVFNKPLRTDQNHLVGTAIHLSDEIERIKKFDPNADINVFIVDGDPKHCLNLTAFRNEFKDTIKNCVTINYRNPQNFEDLEPADPLLGPEGWLSAIQLAMSKEEDAVENFQKKALERKPHLNLRLSPEKIFYTDLENEIKLGNSIIIKELMQQYSESRIKNHMDQTISFVVLAAECANKAKDERDLANRHEIFFRLLAKILFLAKKSTHLSILKACYQIFKHPEIDACFANIKQKTSLIEFLINPKYGIRDFIDEPLSTIKYFLEFVKDTEIKNAKQCSLVIDVISKKGNSRETIDIVKQLIEERGCGFEGEIKKYPTSKTGKSALLFSIGYDTDDKDRFALCDYLLSKGANLNDLGPLLLELIDQNNLSGIRYICENTSFDWTNYAIPGIGKNPLDFVCRRHLTYKPVAGEPQRNPRDYLPIAQYFVDLGLKPTINLDIMLSRRTAPEVTQFIKEVLVTTAKNPCLKPKELKQMAEVKESKNSTSLVKSAFDPLYQWVSYLTAHHQQIDEEELDDLIYYGRWLIAVGGNVKQLMAASGPLIQSHKDKPISLIAVVRSLVSSTQPPKQVKSLEQIKLEFAGESKEVKFALPKETIEAISKRFKAIERFQKEISQCDYKEFNKRLAASVATCQLEFKNDKSLVSDQTHQLLAFLRIRHWQVTGIYLNDVQMFNVIALITDPDKCKLAQIKTGEGKTRVIALLCAYYGLLGLKPDVFTTHDDLAMRDVHMLEPFYNSLGLTVGCESHSQNTDQQVDILYGTTRSIQGNGLGKETGLCQSRGNRPFDIALFDEADNLFIDSKHMSLRLLFNGLNYAPLIDLYIKVEKHFSTHEIHPEKWISQLAQEMKVTLKEGDAADLYKAWSTNLNLVLNSSTTHEMFSFYAKISEHFNKNLDQIASLAKTCKVVLKAGEAKQIFKDWALARHFLKINEDYHVTLNENGPGVELIDRHNTGQREVNVRLNKAHTFLEIINGIPPDMKEAIFCHTSNVEFLKLYQHGCKCVTGTGGELHDRQELLETCGMTTYDSPSYKPNIKQSLRNLIVPEAKYDDALIHLVKEHRNKQEPVVIFADTVAQSNQFAQLLRGAIGQEHIQVYNALQKDIPESIVKNAGLTGMVTIVTNIGGRGMDIVTQDDHNLHLIFTNLFKNRRVESQAIGRTGRQGKKGTYHYLLSAENVCEKLREPKTNAAKIMEECDAAIAHWYDKQRDKVLHLQKSEFVHIRVTHVVQLLQQFFMSLKDDIKELKFYRWASFISDVGSYKNTEGLTGKKLELKAIENTLRHFNQFWKECGLSPELLSDSLRTYEHAELAKVIKDTALAQSFELMDMLRPRKIPQKSIHKDNVSHIGKVGLFAASLTTAICFKILPTLTKSNR